MSACDMSACVRGGGACVCVCVRGELYTAGNRNHSERLPQITRGLQNIFSIYFFLFRDLRYVCAFRERFQKQANDLLQFLRTPMVQTRQIDNMKYNEI